MSIESAPRSPASPGALRAGIALAVVLAVAGALPAVLDIGFDGSGWDVVVVVVAVLSPAIAAATVVLAPFAWRGRPRPCVAIATLQVVAMLPALPPFFHAPGLLPPEASIAALVGMCLNALAASLVLVGRTR